MPQTLRHLPCQAQPKNAGHSTNDSSSQQLQQQEQQQQAQKVEALSKSLADFCSTSMAPSLEEQRKKREREVEEHNKKVEEKSARSKRGRDATPASSSSVFSQLQNAQKKVRSDEADVIVVGESDVIAFDDLQKGAPLKKRRTSPPRRATAATATATAAISSPVAVPPIVAEFSTTAQTKRDTEFAAETVRRQLHMQQDTFNVALKRVALGTTFTTSAVSTADLKDFVLKPIPETFAEDQSSPCVYASAFFPSLVYELRYSLVRAFRENDSKEGIRDDDARIVLVQGAALSKYVHIGVEYEADFTGIKATSARRVAHGKPITWMYSDGDIVAIMAQQGPQSPTGPPTTGPPTAGPTTTGTGGVSNDPLNATDTSRVYVGVVVLPDRAERAVKIELVRTDPLSTFVTEAHAQKRIVHLRRLQNLHTYYEANAALHNITQTVFWSTICTPESARQRSENLVESSQRRHSSMELSQQTGAVHKRKGNHNTSQLAAIDAAVSSSNEFVLIQGPPGTGKTHTVDGIVSRLLSSTTRSRILVVAPSNVAVDEVLLRVKKAHRSVAGGKALTLIRVGIRENVDPSCLECFLEDRVEQMVRQKEFNASRCTTDRRKAARDAILHGADIVFSTLGSLRNFGIPFECVIIDECSQAVEPACLVPLCLGCRRCILIGDPMQLQATVISLEAAQAGFGRSIMERLLNHGHASILLDEQYRMHPTIAEFPNQEFYTGRLRNGARAASIISYPPRLSRMWFVDVPDGKERVTRSSSLMNDEEANFIVSRLLPRAGARPRA